MSIVEDTSKGDQIILLKSIFRFQKMVKVLFFLPYEKVAEKPDEKFEKQ